MTLRYLLDAHVERALALGVPGLRIADPGCVAKTFPDFFARFAALTRAEAGGKASDATD